MQTISAETNIRAADVKPRSGGRSQNRPQAQKSPMEHLLPGEIA
jgi:hypothetical protein